MPELLDTILKVVKIDPPQPSENFEDFTFRLTKKINGVSEEIWGALGQDAQEWHNEAILKVRERRALRKEGKEEEADEIELPVLPGFGVAPPLEDATPEEGEDEPVAAPKANGAGKRERQVKQSPVEDAAPDRSPAYPVLSLETALARLTEFSRYFNGKPAPVEELGAAWGVKAKTYADRTAAALRYFGLLGYDGVGKDRRCVVSPAGQAYLHGSRSGLKDAALRVPPIAACWKAWGVNQPEDEKCLEELVDKHGFSDAGAKKFLKVYNATIAYAGLTKGAVADDFAEDEPAAAGEVETVVPMGAWARLESALEDVIIELIKKHK